MMRLLRHIGATIRSLGCCCRGAALVEWTLVLPFLLTLGLGFMEFGHALYQYQQIANGIRDAGRYLSRQDVDDSTTPPKFPADVLENARLLATTGSIKTGSPLRVCYWEPSDVKAEVHPEKNVDPDTGLPKYRGGEDIYVVEVTTTVSYGKETIAYSTGACPTAVGGTGMGIGFLDFFGLGPITFNLSHQERVIGE